MSPWRSVQRYWAVSIFLCGLLSVLTLLSSAQNQYSPKRGENRLASREIPAILWGVKTIVTLGDSITQAGGEPGGYVWRLQRYLNALYPAQKIRALNAGVSGHKATDMQVRFQRDVLDKKPDLVTISVGVNDVWHAFRDFEKGVDHPEGDLPAGVPLPLYREKLEAMILAAKAANVRVALLSPTLIYENLESRENARLAEYIRAMRELAEKHNCHFIDLNAAFRETIRVWQKHAGRTVNLLTTDGVHMNAAGNQLMAYSILRGLGVSEKRIADLDVR